IEELVRNQGLQRDKQHETLGTGGGGLTPEEAVEANKQAARDGTG
ncbi:hypothetical protein LCGC14_2485640, partial [marine sediment metagenome]